MFGTRLVVGVFLLCSARPILALDPDQPLNQLYHTSWTAKDGLQGTVTSFAQTSDGFLWIGTTEGLFRFDGVKFEAYKPEAGSFPATAVLTLCAAREGLWIGYVAGGVSLLKNGRLRNYSSSDGLPISNISGIIEDGEGTIWVSAVGGLARLEGDRWHIVRMDWNYPSRAAEILTGDTRGTLWAATRHRIMFLPKGSRKFQDTGVEAAFISDLSVTADGVAWYAETGNHQVCSLRQDGATGKFTTTCYSSDARAILVDRDGSLWLLNLAGCLRVAHPERLQPSSVLGLGGDVEQVTENEGLTSNAAVSIFEDRESNMWVGSDRGLDRFRRRNVWWYPTPGKLSISPIVLMIGDGGEVWAASSPGPMLRLPAREPVASAPTGGASRVPGSVRRTLVQRF